MRSEEKLVNAWLPACCIILKRPDLNQQRGNEMNSFGDLIGNTSRLNRNQHGLTLVQLVVVLVILGVIAWLALPLYIKQVIRHEAQEAKAQEAITHILDTRDSLKRFYLSRTDSTGFAYVKSDFSNLDYNPNTATEGQTPLFTYTLTNQAANAYTITAKLKGGRDSDTIVFNYGDSDVTRNGVFK
jgi:Tfp pilus assembly protein PilE